METSPPDPKFLELEYAVATDNFAEVGALISSYGSREWCQKRSSTGHTILQEAIRRNRKEIFDFMLPFHNLEDLEIKNEDFQTALHMAMKFSIPEDVEFFVTKLVRKGVCFHVTNIRLTYLLLDCCWGKITELFLNNNLEVCDKDEGGNTLLHRALLDYGEVNFEVIATLLCYGADPLLRNKSGWNAFELAVLADCPPLIQEILFNYLDDTTEIDIEALLHLAYVDSVYLRNFLNCKVKCLGISGSKFEDRAERVIDLLFKIRLPTLETLLQGADITALIPNATRVMLKRSNFVFWEFLSTDQILLKFELLLRAMGRTMVKFFNALDSSLVFKHVVTKFDDENAATELLIFLLQYGLQSRIPLHLVYSKFGFNELFRFVLCLDFGQAPRWCNRPQQALVEFICDPLLDFDSFMLKNEFHSVVQGWSTLSRFFADPKLRSCLLQRCDEEELAVSRGPLLQELARNVLRKHLAKTFNVRNVGEFISVVNALPVSKEYKKIITLETPLYYYE